MTEIRNCTHNDPSVTKPYAELQRGEMRYYFDCGTEGEVDGSGYVYIRAGFVSYPPFGLPAKQECTMNTCPFHKDHRK